MQRSLWEDGKSQILPAHQGLGFNCENHSQVLLEPYDCAPTPPWAVGALKDVGQPHGQNKGAKV